MSDKTSLGFRAGSVSTYENLPAFSCFMIIFKNLVFHGRIGGWKDLESYVEDPTGVSVEAHHQIIPKVPPLYNILPAVYKEKTQVGVCCAAAQSTSVKSQTVYVATQARSSRMGNVLFLLHRLHRLLQVPQKAARVNRTMLAGCARLAEPEQQMACNMEAATR
uniref:Uncharacterized protein n=1 Tax=Moniliophthora roreri TaxID=221103 RepID=A0A0W0GB23_MONRR